MVIHKCKFFFKIIIRWLWLAIRLKPLRFSNLDTNQQLLFQDTNCRLIWNIEGGCFVKVYLNGKKLGLWLPENFPVIRVENTFNVEVVVFGAYKRQQKSLTIPVHQLSYKEASGALLKTANLLFPPVVHEVLPRLKYKHPLTPKPVICLQDILLDTHCRMQEELALHEQLNQQETILENT